MLSCAPQWRWIGLPATCSVADSLKLTSLTLQPRTPTSDLSHPPRCHGTKYEPVTWIQAGGAELGGRV